MIICKTCIMPNTRPDTPFVDGECAACINYKNRPAIDWAERKSALKELVARAKAKGKTYDCIVPSSGGKDSTYQVIRMLEFGLRPLVVTASTCHLTAMGRANIDNLARYATTIEVTPNKAVRSYLNREALIQVGDVSWPEHAAIFSIPWRIAAQTGIDLIMYGENPQNQYGGPVGSEDAMTMGARWRNEFGGFLGLRPSDFVGEAGIVEEDMANYQIPDAPDLELVEVHFLGQYLPWDSHENAAVSIKHGMSYRCPSEANWWEWENLDNAQTGLHDWFAFLKYGYTRGQAQLSVDIRTGRTSRELALQQCKRLSRKRPSIYAGVPLQKVIDAIKVPLPLLVQTESGFTNQEIKEEVAAFWEGV